MVKGERKGCRRMERALRGVKGSEGNVEEDIRQVDVEECESFCRFGYGNGVSVSLGKEALNSIIDYLQGRESLDCSSLKSTKFQDLLHSLLCKLTALP